MVVLNLVNNDQNSCDANGARVGSFARKQQGDEVIDAKHVNRGSSGRSRSRSSEDDYAKKQSLASMSHTGRSMSSSASQD